MSAASASAASASSRAASEAPSVATLAASRTSAAARASFSGHVPPTTRGATNHRASLVVPTDYDEDQISSLSLVNVAVATMPYPIICMCPIQPYFHTRRNGVFNPHTAWKSAIHGIKAIKRLKSILGASANSSLASDGSPHRTSKMRSELNMITGHASGHMNLWNADQLAHTKSCTHFNGVTVESVAVCNTVAYTTVRHSAGHGSSADSATIYMWDLVTMSLKHVLEGHDDAVTVLAVDEQNEFRLISAGQDKNMCVWNTRGKNVPSLMPERRFAVKGGTICQMVVSAQFDICICGTHDGYLRVIHIESGTVQAQSDAHTAQITSVKWHTPIQQPSSPMVEEHGYTTLSSRPSGVVVTTCLNGYIRGYYVSPPETVEEPVAGGTGTTTVITSPAEFYPRWANRSHKASVNDVCWDYTIVMSVSCAENNVTFFNIESQATCRCHIGDGGLRVLACDPLRKAVVAGSDSGQVIVLNYKALASTTVGDFGLESNVSVVAILHPHAYSVSGIVIERSLRDTWDRIITSGRDGSICVLDFDLDRDSRTFHGATSTAGTVSLRGGKFTLTAWDREYRLIDTKELRLVTSTPQQYQNELKSMNMTTTLENHPSRIVAIRFDADRQRIITAGIDGCIRFHGVRPPPVGHPGGLTSSQSHAIEDTHPAFFLEGFVQLEGGAVTCLSEVANGIIAIGVQRTNSRVGSVLLMDVDRRIFLGPQQSPSVQFALFPVRVSLLAETRGSDHVICVVQQRNGEVLSFHVSLSTPNSFSPIKLLCDETVSNYMLELEPTMPYPMRFDVHLTEETQPASVEVLSAEGSINRAVKLTSYLPFAYQRAEDRTSGWASSGTTSAATSSSSVAPVSRGVLNALWSLRFEADVEHICQVRSSGVAAAIALQDSSVHIVNTGGPLSAVVRYDGSVVDVVNASRPRRCLYKTSTESATSTGRVFPACSAVAACAATRLLAIGYRDGVYQLLDLATKMVIRRVHAFGMPVTNFEFCFGAKHVAASTGTGTLRLDALLNRSIRAVTEADPSQPVPVAA